MFNNLSDAIPRNTLEKRFEDIREDVLADNVHQLTRNLQPRVPSVCLFIWDEMVHRGVTKEPRKMALVYPDKQEKIYQFVKRELNAEPISDAYYAKFYSDLDTNKALIKIELCQCYPNDIHIGDVVFRDLSQPALDQSKISPRSHKGLRIFPEFIERLTAIGKNRGVERISLVAASPAAHEVFARHGFAVSNTPVGQEAFRQLGYSHPMILKI